MLINGDGICCFHLAGVIGLLCSDPEAVASGKTSCSGPELDLTRELILFNFTRWRDRVRELSSDAELEEKVYTAVSRQSKQYLLHAAGLTTGMDLQGDVQDLAIYTLFLDIRVMVVHVDMIRANSSDKELEDACMVAGFEGECEKRRVVCAVLGRGHYDLGVVFRPEVKAVFENGPEWESARSVILHFLRAKKAKPQPKEKWTPSAARWPITAATPLLNALRASAGVTTAKTTAPSSPHDTAATASTTSSTTATLTPATASASTTTTSLANPNSAPTAAFSSPAPSTSILQLPLLLRLPLRLHLPLSLPLPLPLPRVKQLLQRLSVKRTGLFGPRRPLLLSLAQKDGIWRELALF